MDDVSALIEAGEYLDALKVYDKLIRAGQATAHTWCGAGDVLTTIGEYAQAVGAYESSLQLEPQNPEARNNLGRVRYRLGDMDAAVRDLRAAADQSDALVSWLNLAIAMPGAPSADHQQVLDCRREFARRLADVAGDTAGARPVRRRGSSSPVRVGYVSEFFHRPNYMKPVWALLNHHDRQSFEIHLFSDSPAGQDFTGFVADARDCVHHTAHLETGELAELIREQQLDILVDLNAYSTPERLELFLTPLAQVTLAWFNLYATSGLPGVDYVVGDEHVIRPSEEPFYSERVLRLPVSYLTFEVGHDAPPVVAPPCLHNGYVTFGSLVSQYKLTPPVLDCWSELLRRVPRSRLVLANAALKSPYNRQYVMDQFVQRGVEAERLELLGPADHFRFLEYYNRMDVALDAFPYNGGTTTMEAVWQGVPVLTFPGDRWASRTSDSILAQTHLRDFVAPSEWRMMELAAEIGGDPATPRRLEQLRFEMRERLRTSAACDGQRLARGMEKLFREVLAAEAAPPSRG